MMDWIALSGYGGFVWGAYGVTALTIVGELVLLAARRRRALAHARAEQPRAD